LEPGGCWSETNRSDQMCGGSLTGKRETVALLSGGSNPLRHPILIRGSKSLLITRVWAMPSKDTFSVKPIGEFVKKYLRESKCSIDPFARNKRWATYTNDLDSNTRAEYHMEGRDFLDMLIEKKIKSDVILCDPPYSQVSRTYKDVGKEYKPFGDDNNAVLYKQIKDKVKYLLEDNGVILTFGWNSSGMGLNRGFEIIEILLVCHGGAHNDTICMAEKKMCCNKFGLGLVL
jgi:hypothetical protein